MAIALDANVFAPRLRRTVYELDTRRDVLRTVYRLSGERLSDGISLDEVRAELGLTDDATDRACDFWARDGVLRFSAAEHLALTYLGVRRAESLERGGWSLADL